MNNKITTSEKPSQNLIKEIASGTTEASKLITGAAFMSGISGFLIDHPGLEGIIDVIIPGYPELNNTLFGEIVHYIHELFTKIGLPHLNLNSLNQPTNETCFIGAEMFLYFFLPFLISIKISNAIKFNPQDPKTTD